MNEIFSNDDIQDALDTFVKRIEKIGGDGNAFEFRSVLGLDGVDVKKAMYNINLLDQPVLVGVAKGILGDLLLGSDSTQSEHANMPIIFICYLLIFYSAYRNRAERFEKACDLLAEQHTEKEESK